MHYVILRDDDTCAFTPASYLDRLYRPFLDRNMPVNLAVIPEVRTDVRTPDGRLEGFISAGRGPSGPVAAIAQGQELVRYLRSEPGYHVAQHGCHHDLFEFGTKDRGEIAKRLDRGAKMLQEAGIPRPVAFVAPYDRISGPAFVEVAARHRLISTGWFEARKVPLFWYPAYIAKKLSRKQHWRPNGTYLLSHPGCLFSFRRDPSTMMASVEKAVLGSKLTVLVQHWWEFFRGGVPDEELIGVLHQLAGWLSSRSDVRVVSFEDVASGAVPIS
ncbi:MAG TPA: DUF2334 domain-containing protein [Opitutaceae bacterium]|jgi:peptidoglycan/xylan/chitin deacetylase (PgdA/CDA1 family)|nr:DUF2334 domain-containing protein [Opitutaceae bacterium]